MDPRTVTVAYACAFALAWVMPASASGPNTSVETPTSLATDAGIHPWMSPIRADYPIRHMSSLRTEYRRIRDLRREQMQPEYERRLRMSGEAAADAWREDTLRDVAKRDLRDLRARLTR